MTWFNDDPFDYRIDCNCDECSIIRSNRIAAFGAIRRAAKVAREFDERGIWDPELWITADAIRRAIRAAIGSEKT